MVKPSLDHFRTLKHGVNLCPVQELMLRLLSSLPVWGICKSVVQEIWSDKLLSLSLFKPLYDFSSFSSPKALAKCLALGHGERNGMGVNKVLI